MSAHDALFLQFSELENLVGAFPGSEGASHKTARSAQRRSASAPVSEYRKSPRTDVSALLRHIRLNADASNVGSRENNRVGPAETTASSYIPKDRTVQTNLFFDRTQNIAAHFEPQTTGNFLAASQSIATLFESDPDLGPAFLEEFVRQSKMLSLKDQDTFNRYLLLIDQLADTASSATVKSFLAVVQDLLDHIEGNLKNLFDLMRTDLDLRRSLLESAEQKLHTGELGDFLQTIEAFLNRAE
jgi:hypothetical protein